MPASAEAWRKASPDPSESSTKPYLLRALYHFTLPQTVGAGGSLSCGSASCGGTLECLEESLLSLTLLDLRMPRRIAVVPLTLRDLGMPRRVTAVPLFDDLLSTPTNQPASLYDEFHYGSEHARLRKIDSRYSVSAGQLPRRGEKLPEASANKHA